MAANIIDLTNIVAVRGYLGLPSGIVSTSIALPISAGPQTVTPLSMANIAVGCYFLIGSGATAEYVLVTAVTSTTFSAVFANSHAAGASVLDKTDAVLQWMITSASTIFLSNTGQDSLNSINTYNEAYDGNGNNTLMLRQNPIVSVISLQINARIISASTSPVLPGYVIDSLKKAIMLRSGGSTYSVPFNFSSLSAYYGGGLCSSGGFPRGVQNIQVNYTAGYPVTPYDVFDKTTQLVAVNYKRTNWIDEASQNMSGTGSTTFQKWTWPPEVEECMTRYQRSSRS